MYSSGSSSISPCLYVVYTRIPVLDIHDSDEKREKRSVSSAAADCLATTMLFPSSWLMTFRVKREGRLQLSFQYNRRSCCSWRESFSFKRLVRVGGRLSRWQRGRGRRIRLVFFFIFSYVAAATALCFVFLIVRFLREILHGYYGHET